MSPSTNNTSLMFNCARSNSQESTRSKCSNQAAISIKSFSINEKPKLGHLQSGIVNYSQKVTGDALMRKRVMLG